MAAPDPATNQGETSTVPPTGTSPSRPSTRLREGRATAWRDGTRSSHCLGRWPGSWPQCRGSSCSRRSARRLSCSSRLWSSLPQRSPASASSSLAVGDGVTIQVMVATTSTRSHGRPAMERGTRGGTSIPTSRRSGALRTLKSCSASRRTPCCGASQASSSSCSPSGFGETTRHCGSTALHWAPAGSAR